MKQLTDKEKEVCKENFKYDLDLNNRINLEYIHEYIKKIRPFDLKSYVEGVAEDRKISGYVEAFYVDSEGNLSMVITINKFEANERVRYVDSNDFKSFKKVEII